VKRFPGKARGAEARRNNKSNVSRHLDSPE
jgi:hypothetical protein